MILDNKFNFDTTNLNNQEILKKISKVAGLDISASKIDDTKASVAIIILDFESKAVLYENSKLVTLTQPYVPGFLAFREVEHLNDIINNLKKNHPEFLPDVIIVDGNGIYHSNGFGLACHLGILCDLPTIGCGKTTFYVDGLSAEKVDEIAEKYLFKKTDYVKLEGNSGIIHGAAMRCSSDANNNIIVSQGHKITLDTACLIVKRLLKFKVVEPVRLADIYSREEIRKYDLDLKNKNIFKNKK